MSSPLFFWEQLGGLPRLWFGRFTIQGSGCKRTTLSGCLLLFGSPLFVETKMAVRRLSFGRFANGCTKRLAIWPSRAVIPVVSPPFFGTNRRFALFVSLAGPRTILIGGVRSPLLRAFH